MVYKVILLLILLCQLVSCQKEEQEEPFTYIPETISPEVETSDATVFRWAEPSVFRITEPVVQTEVSNTEFKELYSAGKKAHLRTDVLREPMWKKEKLCLPDITESTKTGTLSNFVPSLSAGRIKNFPVNTFIPMPVIILVL